MAISGRSNDLTSSSTGITITWRNLSVYVYQPQQKFFSGGRNQRNRIVNNASGSVKAGKLVALMGPSGSGKSTLMKALANRSPNNMLVDGEILVNGMPIGGYLNKISGYMHQEDLFVGGLTVKEHLTLMIWLKIGRNKESSDVSKLVTDLLFTVGLTGSADKFIDLSCGSSLLSGGEKKKLAFATEMITDPRVFFCDEPTTGLDSYSAQSVVHLMNRMAFENRTVLCTIHQPSSEIFDMFDNLILLVGGRVAFFGSSKRALLYFERRGYICPKNYNPAEFFMRTLTKDMDDGLVNRFCDEFIVSDDATLDSDTIEAEDLLYKMNWSEPRWTTKFYALTYRSFLQVLRDPSVQGVRILYKLGIALLGGLCFTGINPLTQAGIQSVQGAVFLFVTENTFPGMYAVLSLFPQEMPLFIREYRDGVYSPGLFYLSKMASWLPGLILDPLLFVIVFYWIAGLRYSLYAFSITVLIAVLTSNVATACGSLFSNAFDNVSIAMACLVPFDFMLMVTSGIFINLDSLPKAFAWFRHLSWFMYSNEAIMIAQWDGVQNISCEYTNRDIPCLTTGSDVLNAFKFSPSHLYTNVVAVLIIFVVFHALASFFLWRKARNCI